MLFGSKLQSKCIFLNYLSQFLLSSSQLLNVKNNPFFFFPTWHFVGNSLHDATFFQLKQAFEMHFIVIFIVCT